MMKNLDRIELEKREREAGEALLSEVQADDQSQRPDTQPEPQSAESGGERLYTKEEVRQIVSEAVARERVNVECREYLLAHYYGMERVSDEIDRVLRILEPKSVDDLAAKMEEVEALDSTGGNMTSAGASSKGLTSSLRQIFVRS